MNREGILSMISMTALLGSALVTLPPLQTTAAWTTSVLRQRCRLVGD